MEEDMGLFKRIISVTLVFALLVCTASFSVSSAEAVTDESVTETVDDSLVDVVVLVNDVAAGRKVKSTDVEIKKYKNANLPKNIISDTSKVVGKYAKTQLYAGEYVYGDQLSDTSKAQSSTSLLKQTISKSKEGFLDVTDYILADTGMDVTTHLQKIIDTNPGRTIYFPDGEYIISKPLTTKGAALYTVSLWLADGAVIKADPDRWRFDEGGLNAMICLGAADAFQPGANDVVSTGSYYSLQGGTIDCSGVAEGVSIDGGRETLVKNIVIKNAHNKGIHIKKGANNAGADALTGSSDADFHHVTIICDGKPGSIGLHIDKGLDNHFSNFRIYDAQIGVKMNTAGNSMKNIRVYYTHSSKLDALDSIYSQTVGILDESGDNFFTHCYVENYATAFNFRGGREVVDSCTARWTSEEGGTQIAVAYNGTFASWMTQFRAEFYGSAPDTALCKNISNGQFETPIVDMAECDTFAPSNRVNGGTVPLS